MQIEKEMAKWERHTDRKTDGMDYGIWNMKKERR